MSTHGELCSCCACMGIFGHAQKGHVEPAPVLTKEDRRHLVTGTPQPEPAPALAGKRPTYVIIDELADLLKPAPKPETFKDRQRKRPKPGWAVELGLGLGPRFKSKRFP